MKSNMRIALFSGNYNYQTDGANKALNILVGYLESQGVEVLVFSPTSSNPAFAPTGTLISVPSVPIPGRGEYRIGTGLSSELKRQIEDFNPSLIHLSAPDILGHSALKLAESLSVPAVASYHTRFDTYFEYYKLGLLAPYCRRMMTRFYRRCEHVYVPSKSVGETLRKDGIVGNNLRYWGRGIDCKKYAPANRNESWRHSKGIGEDDIVLGFVGRLVKEKGLDVYVGLLKNLQKENRFIKALIVGDGPERESVRNALPEAILTGHLDGKNLARAYASCDIFINPSRTETFGNVTLEAMASGVPAICLDATGSTDIVKDGRTGWLMDNTETVEWERKIIELCKNKALRRRMSEASRRLSNKFNWDWVMSNLFTQYLELANPEPVRRPMAAE